MCIGSNKPAPASNDLAGWKQAVEDGSFRDFRPEDLVAAMQDLGTSADKAVKNSLALHLSEEILRCLRKLVGINHSDCGNDIIERTHGKIIEAMLQPGCADGKGLREAFKPRIKMRMLDAIRVEKKQEERKNKLREKIEAEQPSGALKISRAEELAYHKLDGGDFLDGFGDDRNERGEEADVKESDDALGKLDWFVTKTDPRERILEDIDVNRALEKVSDMRKRLAFRLKREGVPLESTKNHVFSIAKALRISGKTASLWIDEVHAVLMETVGGEK